MTDAVIRLDKSRPFSECRGERAPDDPHYRVHFWQGQILGRDIVLLPFDAAGELIPDDGKTVDYPGLVDGKPVMHKPLYSPAMRKLLELKKKRQKVVEAPAGTEDGGDDAEGSNPGSLVDDVNFVSWLRGEARYEWPLLQVAAKARFSRVFTSKKEMVADLVLDEKIVPEDQLSPDLAKLLPAKQAA